MKTCFDEVRLLVTLMLESESQMCLEEVDKNESTLVDAKRAISHEEIEQLKHFSFHGCVCLLVSYKDCALLNHTVVNLQLLALRVAFVFGHDNASWALLAKIVQLQIKDLSFDCVGQTTTLDDIFSD